MALSRIFKTIIISLFFLGIAAYASNEEEHSLAIDSLSLVTEKDKMIAKGDTAIVLDAKDKEVIEKSTKTTSLKKPYELNSTKAVLFSIIPGGGQIYNRQYWKLPIIIGAYTACYYAISWNNANLQEYTTAFKEIKSETPMAYDTWKDFLPYNANPEDYINNTAFHDKLKGGRDFYRRYRDMSIIITVAVYALVMIDSYVDAELHNFDISPDLTLSYAPAIIPTQTPQSQSNGIGLHLALTF